MHFILEYRDSLVRLIVTYASFAGLCIIATSCVGFVKFNQVPNFYTIVGLILIISGVVIVNLLGNKN